MMRFGISYVKDPDVEENVKEICDILKSRSHSFELEKGMPIYDMKSAIILAIGDDANILRTFRELGDRDCAVLGINLDMKSFLGEIDIEDFKPALKLIEKKKYFIESRTRIAAEVNGKKLPYALNELVVSPCLGTTMMRYGLIVNGELIFRDFADGIIISTPTGSTGYALSAGGPVISVKSDVFLAIPVCSLEQNKPFVINDKSVVDIADISSRGKCEIVVDGRYRMDLDQNKIRVQKSHNPAKFVRFERNIKTLNSGVFRKLKKRGLDAGTTEVPKGAAPSAKYVYKILKYEGAMTQKEVAESSMLPARTVRFALDYLVKNGFVSRQTSVRDTRQSVYFAV